MLAEGNYSAKIVGGMFEETKKGNLCIRVEFETLKAPTTRISWRGYPEAEKTEFMYKTLATMGFDDQKAMTKLENVSAGKDPVKYFGPEMFKDPKKEFEIVVGHEEFEGKTHAKIKFVNEPFGSKYTADPEKAKNKLGSLGFSAKLAAARAEMGIKPDEEIPF